MLPTSRMGAVLPIETSFADTNAYPHRISGGWNEDFCSFLRGGGSHPGRGARGAPAGQSKQHQSRHAGPRHSFRRFEQPHRAERRSIYRRGGGTGFLGNQILLPAGAKVHGTVTGVERPKWVSMFRGGASINLVFNSIEVESRIFPARMSILSIYQAGSEDTKRRKDLSTVEGVVVQERQDIKTDVEDVAIGTAGGSTAGLVFSRVLRGTLIGLVGGSAYVVAKKGKDVELPAQTGMLVRMDSNLSVPSSLMHNASFTTTSN